MVLHGGVYIAWIADILNYTGKHSNLQYGKIARFLGYGCGV
jgi:hypothetical protein